MGETRLTPAQVEDLVYRMADRYMGTKYDILTKNCNSFANELCLRLVDKGLPPWVNRLAWMGSKVRCCLPQSLVGAKVGNTSEDEIPMLPSAGCLVLFLSPPLSWVSC